jgi:hypothetical protein
MRQAMQVLGVASLFVVVGIVSFSHQDGQPRAGETVVPLLDRPVSWTAGASGGLAVRLYARAADTDVERLLGFRALPWDRNPVAHISFYAGAQPLSTLEVVLSHRC